MRYQITDNNEVLCFIDPQPNPVLSQPYDPETGNAFATKAAAEKWAKAQVKVWEESQPEPDFVVPVPTPAE